MFVICIAYNLTLERILQFYHNIKMDSYLDYIDLGELPDDLRVEILSREPSAHQKMTKLTAGIAKSSEAHRLKSICLKSISMRELEKYKEEYTPHTICE